MEKAYKTELFECVIFVSQGILYCEGTYGQSKALRSFKNDYFSSETFTRTHLGTIKNLPGSPVFH